MIDENISVNPVILISLIEFNSEVVTFSRPWMALSHALWAFPTLVESSMDINEQPAAS
jgi:hypothetical protein